MRASDADRQQVADVLGAAYAEGRLTLDEHDERLDQAMSAKTFDELIPVTRDLVYAAPTTPPAPAPAGPPPTAAPTSASHPPVRVDTTGASPEPERLIAVFAGATRSGRWRIRRQTQAFAVFGGVDLDLRDATFEAPVVEISGFWCFGGMTLLVPPGVEVRDQSIGVFGGSDLSRSAPAEPGAPVVVIKGLCLFGGITVQTPRPRRDDRVPSSSADGDGWNRGDLRTERHQRRLERHDRRSDRHDRRRSW